MTKIESLLLAMLISATTAIAGWEKLPQLPGPNGGFICGVLADKIVLLGGTNWVGDTKQWLDVIWTFDPATLKRETHGRLPHPLAYAVTAQTSSGLLIAGGSDGTQPRKEIWRITAV